VGIPNDDRPVRQWQILAALCVGSFAILMDARCRS
jgi:hypothetical protein